GLMLAGYKIKKIAFFVIWFVIGWTLMEYLMPIINSAVAEIAANGMMQWLLPLCGGLIVALLGFSIEKLCVGGICFGLVVMITAQYFGTEIQTLIIGAILGVVAAGLAVTLMKPAIIVATSVAGAYLTTMSLISIFPEISEQVFYWPMLIGGSVIGSVFQFLTTRRD
ncbi:MAG: hypothetical protein Q4B34_01905, partial [Candidatus Saccharibacteria bacterium]|nr:hypothetical protein [Candidatus Saccharibacteria bacterium]